MMELYERLAALEGRLGQPGSPIKRQFAEALQGLQLTLQELEVAEEALAQRNEELVATRERLEIERHRYRDLFELAPDGYLITDGSGTIEEGNRTAAALLRTTQTGLRGRPLTVYVSRTDSQTLRALLRRVNAREPVRDLEMELMPLGASTPVPVQVTVERDEEKIGRPSRLRWVLRDVSARKSAEAALRESEERLRHSQRLEAVGRLAGGIAHSFNNLLAAIGFHGELLLERLEGEDRDHMEEIRKACDRAASLASQLLAFSRRQVLQPRVLRLDDVLRRMEPMLRRLIGEDVELRLALDSGSGALQVDLGQLEQVILNLVANARDAMPYGGRLELATTAAELAATDTVFPELPPGDYVKLTVSDNGDGMDEEVRSRLFEPFFTTKRDKGTGLGLATVHGIVLQSGGDIRAESAPGQGTTFTILLPRVEAAAEMPQAANPLRRDVQGSEVILLVEDEDNIRRPATEILESRGYTVLAAHDAIQALTAAQQYDGPIHLMLTDVVMPGLSGSQLAERLARLRPEVKVLFMSGYPEDAIAHHGVLEPGRRFLQKPFAVSLLLQTVREVLDNS